MIASIPTTKKLFGAHFNKPMLAEAFYKTSAADIPDLIKKMVAREFMWIWSEFDRKFIGCPYWSSNAIAYMADRIIENPSEFLTKKGNFKAGWTSINTLNPGKKNKPDLVHEHATPKSFAITALDKKPLASPQDAYDFMEEHARGVVVTEFDRAKLDSKFKSNMPDPEKYTWLDRYVYFSIPVYQLNWDALEKLQGANAISQALTHLLTSGKSAIGGRV